MIFMLAACAVSVRADVTLDDIFAVTEAINNDAKASHVKVDEQVEERRDLLYEYKRVLKEIDGLRVFNRQLERQIRHQEDTLSKLNKSIDDVTVIGRQVVPLMLRMIDTLEQFVENDMPFLQRERQERVEKLRDMMSQSNVAVSEQFSQVMRAYQIENEYGRTMTPYSASIMLDGTERIVDILQIGRVALVFQTSNGEETGWYNKASRQWERLGDEYTVPIRKRFENGPQAVDNGIVCYSRHCSRRRVMKLVHKFTALTCGLLVCGGLNLIAQEETTDSDNVFEEVDLEVVQTDSLEELLQFVKDRRVVENQLHAQREREFVQAKNEQARLLANAEQERRNEERRSEQLETRFETNEVKIGDQQELLDKRLGSLRELFGVLSGVAGDARSKFATSITNSQFPNRGKFLGDLAAKMGTATELASIEEMEELWYLLQQNMTESGNIVRYDATVNMITTGEQVTSSVVRIGEFNLIDHDGYVIYDTEIGKLSELARQPSGEFHRTTVDLFEAPAGEVIEFAIDPTKGSLLSLEVQRATLGEMVGTPFDGIATGKCWLPFCDGQGGIVGSIIILVGIMGVALSIERLVTLSIMARKVNSQKQTPGEPSDKNPLGRVISVYQNNRDVDIETLQLKMGEARVAGNASDYAQHRAYSSDIGGCAVDGSSWYGNRDDFDLPGDHVIWYRRSEDDGWRYFDRTHDDGTWSVCRDSYGVVAFIGASTKPFGDPCVR